LKENRDHPSSDSFPSDVTQRPKFVINRIARTRCAPRSSCSFFGAAPRVVNRKVHRAAPRRAAPRRAASHANGIWAQRLCSCVHACTDAGRPRNIIAVIRWNWGSLALTRVLGASTCCVPPRENRQQSRARQYARAFGDTGRPVPRYDNLEVSVS